jgi:hypothetical protein
MENTIRPKIHLATRTGKIFKNKRGLERDLANGIRLKSPIKIVVKNWHTTFAEDKKNPASWEAGFFLGVNSSNRPGLPASLGKQNGGRD